MDIEEAKRRKYELQSAISSLIAEFESQTGLSVDRIDVERVVYQWLGDWDRNPSKLIGVKVETQL